MSKAFVKEVEGDDDELEVPQLAAVRNYITAQGYGRLKQELIRLLNEERPEVVRTVSWAASNGDRSENGDYIYGKKRLREIDRRIRFLTKRLDVAEVVDASAREETDQIFFGATVRYATEAGVENSVTIVGVDEVDPAQGYVSWISPIATALLKAHSGDTVTLCTPAGVETLEILDVNYLG
ncbi:MAG TPA: transcription elongation factor GreB [Burkholderiaceae bacterium]|nr:transcription elongation factor GreB [Burkholderiaceae bacterium]